MSTAGDVPDETERKDGRANKESRYATTKINKRCKEIRKEKRSRGGEKLGRKETYQKSIEEENKENKRMGKKELKKRKDNVNEEWTREKRVSRGRRQMTSRKYMMKGKYRR